MAACYSNMIIQVESSNSSLNCYWKDQKLFWFSAMSGRKRRENTGEPWKIKREVEMKWEEQTVREGRSSLCIWGATHPSQDPVGIIGKWPWWIPFRNPARDLAWNTSPGHTAETQQRKVTPLAPIHTMHTIHMAFKKDIWLSWRTSNDYLRTESLCPLALAPWGSPTKRPVPC